jgi:hypothetical protein
MTPGPEDEVTQAERRRILREGTTFHRHAQAFADEVNQGRFAATGVPTVTGSTPIPVYPAGPQWTADPGSQVVEPPLGFSIDQLEPSMGTTRPTEDTGAPAGAAAAAERLPSGSAQSDDAGASFSKDQDDG